MSITNRLLKGANKYYRKKRVRHLLTWNFLIKLYSHYKLAFVYLFRISQMIEVPHFRILKIENTNECTCILTSVFGISFHQTVSYVLITEWIFFAQSQKHPKNNNNKNKYEINYRRAVIGGMNLTRWQQILYRKERFNFSVKSRKITYFHKNKTKSL